VSEPTKTVTLFRLPPHLRVLQSEEPQITIGPLVASEDGKTATGPITVPIPRPRLIGTITGIGANPHTEGEDTCHKDN
jgi:hypothetical protein